MRLLKIVRVSLFQFIAVYFENKMPLPSLFSGYIRRTLTLTSSVARRNYHSLDKLATPTLVEPGKCVLNEEWTSFRITITFQSGQIWPDFEI